MMAHVRCPRSNCDSRGRGTASCQVRVMLVPSTPAPSMSRPIVFSGWYGSSCARSGRPSAEIATLAISCCTRRLCSRCRGGLATSSSTTSTVATVTCGLGRSPSSPLMRAVTAMHGEKRLAFAAFTATPIRSSITTIAGQRPIRLTVCW